MAGKPIDLSGQKFGKLTAIKIVEHGGYHKPVKWLCKCDCGNEKIVDSQLLRRGIITDCGCKVTQRLTGQRFGHLLVLGDSKKRDKTTGGIIWKCKCDCGNITYVSTNNLCATYHKTKSCGCSRTENTTKHNLSKTPIYKCWTSMKQRCLNPNNFVYKDYGGRGIKVCDEWQEFQPFYDWAMANGYRDDLTIDRINNNGNYEPSNCRWTTMKEQGNNKRTCRYIEYNNQTKTIAQWAKEYNLSYSCLRHRIVDLDLPIHIALTTPARKLNKKEI